MPELPEVETTRRGISPHIIGKKVTRCIIRNHQMRWPIPDNLPNLCEGHKVISVDRRGKYLLINFKHGVVLWHLGMSGNLRILLQNTPPQKHDHVDVVFEAGVILRFNDPRRFGSVLWTPHPASEHKLLSNLGPEPLSNEFNGDYLYKASRRSTQGLKTWIMNASVVVGVGNIYANEALFAAGLHPLKVANTLSKPKADTLANHIKRILTYAIERGGTTLRDFVGGDGKPGYFAQELNVYGRGGEPCKQCGKTLTEKAIGQRATVYCTHCQKR